MNFNYVHLKKNLNREKIILSILFSIILMIHIYPIKDLNMIYVLSDEFGYWSAGAYFAGVNWSDVTSNIAYYSYGYSFFLAPLFWAFKDPTNMYKAALVINSLLLSFCLPISYKIIKILFHNKNKYVNMSIAFCISLYPAYILQSTIAWSEALIIFLVWLIILFLLELNCKTSIYKCFFLGVLSIYLYMVHQRNIGIVVSVILIMGIMFFCKKINKKQFGVFLLTIFIMFIIHSIIKTNIQENLWLNSIASNSNDFSAEVDKVFQLFSTKGIIRFLKVAFGHIFYIGAATFITAYLGVLFLVNKIIKSIREKSVFGDNLNIIYFFLFISFTFSLGINIIFMSNPTRVDHVIYGRYIEGILGPVMLLGLGNLIYNSKKRKMDILICIITFVIVSIIANMSLNSMNVKTFNSLSCIGVWKFYKNEHIQMLRLVFFSIIIFVTLSMISSIKIKGDLFKYAALCIIIGLFTPNFIDFNKNIINGHKNNMKISNIIQAINEHEGIPIYFLIDENNKDIRTESYIQFLLGNRTIKNITKDKIDNIYGEHFIITSTKDPFYFGLEEKYEVKEQSAEMCTLWEPKKRNSNDESLELRLGIFNSQVGNKDLKSNEIVSNGKSGFLFFGPYMELNSGNYTFEIEYMIDKDNTISNNIGYVDIVTNEGKVKINQVEIYKKDFDLNNILTLKIPISIQNEVKDLELRTYVNDKVVLTAKSIKVSRENYNFNKNITIDNLYSRNGIIKDDDLVSNGKEGHLVYGPYIGLVSGEYYISGELKLLDNINNLSEIAKIDVFSQEKEIANIIVKKEEVKDNIFQFKIPFTINEDTNNVEFRIYTYDGVVLAFKQFYLSQY